MCSVNAGVPADEEDVDEDGICDDVDDCVGDYDECGICNGRHRPGSRRLRV